jgi:hypothetical protein
LEGEVFGRQFQFKYETFFYLQLHFSDSISQPVSLRRHTGTLGVAEMQLVQRELFVPDNNRSISSGTAR